MYHNILRPMMSNSGPNLLHACRSNGVATHYIVLNVLHDRLSSQKKQVGSSQFGDILLSHEPLMRML